MVALPPSTAVIFPLLFTVATDVLELLQLMVLSSVVSAGRMVVVKVSVLPFSKVNWLLFKLILLMDTFTVTLQVAVFPPQLAVMVAVPPPTAVTFPLLFTVATEVLELLKLTVLSSVVSAGRMVVVSVSVPPISKVNWVLFKLILLMDIFTVT